MFKGLSSYPVFLITLFSLVTISYLASLTLNKVANQFINNQAFRLEGVSVKYFFKNNDVYAEPVGVDCLEIRQVVVFTNGSIKVFNYVSNGNSRLFGPLTLPKDSIETILLCRNGLSEPRILILDVLNSKRIFNGVNVSINMVNPPLLRVNVNSTTCVDKLSFIYGSRFFYTLKPVTLTKLFTVTKGFSYNISGYNIVVVNNSVSPIVVYNDTLSGDINVEERFRDLLELYGEVAEYRKYTLYRFLNSSFVLNPIYRFERIYSTSRSIIYTVNLRLRDNLALDETIAEFGIKHSASISIVDVYGNSYLADVNINYNILVNDGKTIRTINLGNFTGVNDKEITVNLSKLSILPKANVNLRLSITFNIYIKRTPLGPVYVSINHYVHGGLLNNVFLRTYFFDKLVFYIDGVKHEYYPLTNGSIINVLIKANLFNGIFNVTLGDQNYVASNYSSEFRGSFIHVLDLIYPSVTVISPPYVSINATEDNVKIYRLKVTDGLLVTYGLFFTGFNLSLNVIYKPVVLIDQNNFIIVETDANYVYLLNTSTELKLFVPNTSGYLYFEAPVTARLLGFVIYEKFVYETPILVVEAVPRGLTLSISVVYIDGYIKELKVTGSDTFNLEEKPIISLNLTLLNPSVGDEIYIYTSWRTGRIVFLKYSSSIHTINEVLFSNLGSRKYVVFVLDNGVLIPLDTFG